MIFAEIHWLHWYLQKYIDSIDICKNTWRNVRHACTEWIKNGKWCSYDIYQLSRDKRSQNHWKRFAEIIYWEVSPVIGHQSIFRWHYCYWQGDLQVSWEKKIFTVFYSICTLEWFFNKLSNKLWNYIGDDDDYIGGNDDDDYICDDDDNFDDDRDDISDDCDCIGDDRDSLAIMMITLLMMMITSAMIVLTSGMMMITLMMMMIFTKASWLRLVRQRNQVGGWKASPHLSMVIMMMLMMIMTMMMIMMIIIMMIVIIISASEQGHYDDAGHDLRYKVANIRYQTLGSRTNLSISSLMKNS